MENKLLLPALLATATAVGCSPEQSVTKPNIIYILADDLGYGDLGSFGSEKIETPNIDRLAKEGMLFTQHYAGSAVSAPSRSTMLTGLHTGHTAIRGNKPYGSEGQHPMPASTYNIMKMLKANGYTTAAMGKWGLGAPATEGDPNNQGVDEFFGYNCQRLAHNYYPYYLWDNQQRYMLAGNQGQNEGDYAPYIIHQRAKDFITENKDRPFLLYYASILPHAELRLPEEEIAPFRGKYLPEVSYEGLDDGENYRNGPYGSQEDAHAAFAAMITLLDRQVGDIVDHIERLGLSEKTLIIFTSDNGPHQEGGADPDYFNSNGDLRGYKRDLYEGGIRVPMIARWSGKIAANSTSDHISAFWDLMPTVADLLDITPAEQLDGVSFLPTLMGYEQPKHDYLYWELHEKGGRQAVRIGDWKAVVYNIKGGGKIQLYNLKNDISESKNIADQHPEIIAQVENILRDARTDSDIFKFNSATVIE